MKVDRTTERLVCHMNHRGKTTLHKGYKVATGAMFDCGSGLGWAPFYNVQFGGDVPDEVDKLCHLCFPES